MASIGYYGLIQATTVMVMLGQDGTGQDRIQQVRLRHVSTGYNSYGQVGTGFNGLGQDPTSWVASR